MPNTWWKQKEQAEAAVKEARRNLDTCIDTKWKLWIQAPAWCDAQREMLRMAQEDLAKVEAERA